jgi:ABC-type antimicrobial peptide transport system permease subunit
MAVLPGPCAAAINGKSPSSAGAALLALVTVAAALVPGWRASKIEPVVALKYE